MSFLWIPTNQRLSQNPRKEERLFENKEQYKVDTCLCKVTRFVQGNKFNHLVMNQAILKKNSIKSSNYF